MKKFLCLAICLTIIVCTAYAENKSFGSILYNAAVKNTVTAKKAVSKIKESEFYSNLEKKLEEAKQEWEQTGSKEAKKKYEAAKAALEKFTKDVESAEKEAE